MQPSSSGSRVYDTSDRKTFPSALRHLLHTDFPGVFGGEIARFFADRIDQLYERFHPPRSRFKMGQVLWVGVAVNARPTRDKRIEDTELVSIVLDLVTPQDLAQAKSVRLFQTRRARIVRLFRQAYEQGAVLSEADVSLLTELTVNTISRHVMTYERDTGESVPRRGTIHDLGPSVTHKAIICYKHLVEHKPTSQVAQETFHSPEAVEYYVQCFRRVQLCRDNGMSIEDTARATGHSLRLVREYLDLMDQYHVPLLPNPCGSARRQVNPGARPER
jgi:Protein of unknown function (DUF1670)